ncbi:MAG: putative Ig domain-containing protein, partial [Candidatus Solibacter sp.]|nr:putative Ig domain-containing protein [Candidatus Solibacter sp.]
MTALQFLRSALGLSLLAAVLPAQTPLTIVNSSFPAGAVGQFYAQALAATGGLQPYTWSATGNIPPGLTVGSAGIISGTPTTGGTYAFTLKVVDARLTSVSKGLSIVISGPGSSVLTVATTTLPAGSVGQKYDGQLSANGGTPPYQWVAGTGFPASLTLGTDGAVSGTPTAAGTFSFPVQVTDAARTSATGTVSLTISNPPISITTLA